MKKNIQKFLSNNMVTVIFAILCIAAYLEAHVTIAFFLKELSMRITRNTVLILSLLIPLNAGLGLNFSIVLGAMAAQTALIVITHYHLGGLMSILIAILISTPIAALLGMLMGRLFNKTKGQEMITGMISGFFANGIYQLIFIAMMGTVIPMKDTVLMLSGGIGLKSTIMLEPGTMKVLDNIWSVQAYLVILAVLTLGMVWEVVSAVHKWRKAENRKHFDFCWRNLAFLFLFVVFLLLCLNSYPLYKALHSFKLPLSTFLVIAVVAAFSHFLMTTKLGQDFRAIGQDMKVATSAGINVDKTRIIAIVFSTVIAAWGQLISLQNIGSFATFQAHENVSTFTIAALLVGGVTSKTAKVKNVFIGVVLFHTLFIVAPQAGVHLFGNAVFGEYFRTFVSYGVIALSLVITAVQGRRRSLKELQAQSLMASN